MLAVTKVLLDDPLPPFGETVTPDRSTAKTISDVRRVHIPHWKCLQPDKVLVTSTQTSRRTSTSTSQKKRRRDDSDGEYAPYQKVEYNRSAASTIRRMSKRIAATTKPDQGPIATTALLSSFTHTKRSSSSTSALTSASSSSFDRLPTPEFPDASNSPVLPSKPTNRILPPKRLDWLDNLTPLKIGFPPKKRITNDHSHSPSTLYSFKVGGWLSTP